MTKVTRLPNLATLEEEACEWIVKFEGDSVPSIKDIQQFQQWLARSHAHKATLLQIANNWNAMDVLSGLMIPLEQTVKPKRSIFETLILASFIACVSMCRWFGQMISTFIRPKIALPAMVLVVSVSMSYWSITSKTDAPENTYITNMGDHSTHILGDGSVLWLNSNSKVEVNYTENKRLINLVRGEAHFKVKPDVNRPFEVYAGNRMIKAVGTAFSVYRLKDKIEVMVTEGKVDLVVVESTLVIDPENGSPRITQNIELQEKRSPRIGKLLTSLEAGQSVTIALVSENLDTPIVEHELGELTRKLSWLEGKLVFAGESLEEVVAEVSRHTPVIIEIPDPNLRKLRIGGQFQAGETDALFDVLESGFSIKITRLSKNHVQLDAK
jgi:transmembrane sensor